MQLPTVESCKSIVEPNADSFPRFKFQCRLSYGVRPSKHAGSDPEAFCLRPVMAITASVRAESGRIVRAGSDIPHPFQFRSSKEGMDHTAQNRPGSDVDGLVIVWPNASGPEASRCTGIFGPGSWQDATVSLPTIFPLSDSVPFFHRRPGQYCAKPARIRFSSG